MIEILKFEMINKGSLIAKFNVKIAKWAGLVIRDCTLFSSSGKQWVNLPSKEYESNGKKKYFPYLAYEDQEIDKKFKEAILKEALAQLEKVKSSSNNNTSHVQEELPF